MSQDYDFYRKLVMNITSSLELSESLQATYSFLEKEFPIAGVSLHRFLPNLKAMHLDFLVTGNGFHDLDTLIPMSEEGVEFLIQHEQCELISHTEKSSENSVAIRHSQAIADYVPSCDRPYLVAILSVGEDVVGHFGLIGSEVGCFTEEHIHKLQLARVPVSLAMVNMLNHKRAKELQQRLDLQRKELAGEVEFLKDTVIIGREGGMRSTMEMVEQLAGKETPVLILGETGTGKEMIADAVQKVSPRRDGPYVKVNCGAIPETLLDSELFGYQKGAFTGAVSNRAGKFEQAEGGTLFLDEVGELTPQAQVRLLRVLQEGTIDRVGGTRPLPINVRIIAATNRSLEQMLIENTFREDLFYRLNVFPIRLPSLRERKEDIPLLAHHFLQEFSQKFGLSRDVHLEIQSIPKLLHYSWPGNIRELKNLVERGLALDSEGPVDLSQYLSSDEGWYAEEKEQDGYLKKLIREQMQEILEENQLLGNRDQAIGFTGSIGKRLAPLDEVISEHICHVLEKCRGKISGPNGAAEILQVNPSTLRKKMQKLEIPFGLKNS